MLSAGERKQLLSSFPFNEFQLSYENKVHNKVRGAHLTLAIPDGNKAYAWITTSDEDNVCWIMEISNGISNITKLKHEFCAKLSYGTIFYGTSFKCKKGKQSFSLEDVLFYKGKNVCRTSYLNKLELMNDSFKRGELTNDEVLFGMPEMNEQFYTVLNAIPELPYKSSFIHFRYLEGKLTNTTFIMKYIKPRQQQLGVVARPGQQITSTKNSTFTVVANIQPDVYHLTAQDGSTSIACIPSYAVSVMMNSIFRTIKENVSLDALEESDDECEFEDIRVEKYLVKTEPVKMKCEYNYKFKKWVPVTKC
jgi:hypothetical protein